MNENEKIINALLDITDGISAHDLVYITGMPMERAEEICALANKLRFDKC